jgi:formate hydrogenlyase subunit 6/NADH:ubiquinone oxidoreductase subunit I
MPDPAAEDDCVACALCGSETRYVAGVIAGYVQGERFSIHVCGNCDTACATPCRVDTRIYEAIYAQPLSAKSYGRYEE